MGCAPVAGNVLDELLGERCHIIAAGRSSEAVDERLALQDALLSRQAAHYKQSPELAASKAII